MTMFPVFPFLPNNELDKDQLPHVTYAVKWKAQFLLPHWVESVVFDYRRAECDRTSRRDARERRIGGRGVLGAWRGHGRVREEWRLGPVGNVEGYLNEGADAGSIIVRVVISG